MGEFIKRPACLRSIIYSQFASFYVAITEAGKPSLYWNMPPGDKLYIDFAASFYLTSIGKQGRGI